MALPYAKERLIAELAVQRAALLTQAVFGQMDNGKLSKADKSPVTSADFGSQALIIGAIHNNFPGDAFIGEENAKTLRSNPHLQERVWDLVSSTHLDDKESEESLSTLQSPEEMLEVIDLGSSVSSRKGRVWVLDPIDGTLDFIRQGQYAISLALLEDGVQKVGVLGCPSLSANGANMFEAPPMTREHGIILSAVSGQGATSRPLSSGSLLPPDQLPRLPSPPTPSRLRFVDKAHNITASASLHAAVAHHLGTSHTAYDVDSLQLKWATLALGLGDVFVRLPISKESRDWTWDHAGGVLIAQEAGVKVTDAEGREIDFGSGRRLEENFGWVAAHTEVHGVVLVAVREVL